MYIRNKTLTYTPGCTKEFINVPDPNTDDYRLGLARQWLPRIYQEMSDYNNSGGRVVFATFTYRPECIPMFSWIDPGTSKPYCIPGFSAEHKNTYLQDIRNYLDRKYGLRGPTRGQTVKYNDHGLQVKYMSKSFRYMWNCEYGLVDEYIDRHGKKRNGCHQPHYHCLFFIPKEMMDLKEFRTESSVKKFFSSFWPYGFTMWSKPCLDNGLPLGIYCTNEFACEYVSKYCFKSVEFYEQPEVQDFLFVNGKKHPDRYEMIKDFLPRHWQSMSFGVGLSEIFDSEDAMLNGVNFNFRKDVERGRTVMTKCPQYITRKLFYEQLKDGRFVINPHGLKTFVNIFPKKAQRLADKLKQELSPAGIEALIKDDKVLQKLLGHNRDSLQKYIFELMNGRNFMELALYSMVWQGLFLYKPKEVPYLKDFEILDSLSLDRFIEISLEQYTQNLLAHKNAVFYCSDGYFRDTDIIFSLEANGLVPEYYTYCKRFANFDILLEIRNKLRGNYMQNVHNKYLEDRKRRKELKFNLA